MSSRDAAVADPSGELAASTAPDDVANNKLAADYRDRWMRAEADMANVRTRARRDVEDARLYAVQKFATDVVDGVENLRRGLDSLPPQVPGEPPIVADLRDGFSGIERNFLALLKRNGIEREEPLGVPFDANRHQAVSEQESTAAPTGTIVHALSAGWTLNGRLLRPAMVVVAKAPLPPNGTADDARS
ncbi:nucleotide exchange factor GrpE [Lichenifustis flavocetrariae]|uniref:Protein GrpE n=1 Tax=Lichenifustis flavocetrariae TaxID=2949735 RepID=A0AA41Z1A9_9HYPH|nr:nucleotide exchange factor GrpE [Lichenifustis flavocetrariae]MCW6512374.1 nucleotide exchange factor GrpE [Lichenifustis flavocetrariae]